MKRIPLEQGTNEWLSWRKTVITATDCPAILGSSPWSTAYKCWQRKLGLVEEQQSNEAMERGKRLEPYARDLFIAQYGINMIPMVVESSEYEFLGASLDGISDCGKYIIEIKCGGSKLHTNAQIGVIPEYYMHQMQHQLLVTGAEKCFYYSYNGEEGICVDVYPDPQFVANFMPKAREFWKCIAFFEPPALQESDFKDMSQNLYWSEYAKLYQEIHGSIKSLEEKKETLRKKLIEIAADQNCAGNGLKITKVMTKGRVAYDEIPELKDLYLEPYRKSPTNSWKITVQ